MEDLARTEYPAMLAHLQPMQAVTILNDRVKRFNKLNVEIADWLQERRKVEEQYVQSLRKLTQFKVPNSSSELGVFQTPWDRVLASIDSIAHSHHQFAARVEKDIELPLRTFSQKKEVSNIQAVAANLTSVAKELEDAADKAERLNKKGGKAASQKVDAAATRLESAQQQWDSQSPFVFESLQVLDEQRINHLRDLLTQFQTLAVDEAQRQQVIAAEAVGTMVEIDTATEILGYSRRMVEGKPKLEKRASTRQSTQIGGSRQSSSLGGGLQPPGTSSGTHDDETTSEHSGHHDGGGGGGGGGGSQSRLRRIGTMLGRRRQSVHGGFGPISPQKSSGGIFGRGLSSSHGNRGVSPRASAHDLRRASSQQLASLAESPDSPNTTEKNEEKKDSHEGTNGIKPEEAEASTSAAAAAAPSSSAVVNGTDIFDMDPPPGPPPSQSKGKEPERDAEGFSVPPSEANDPISIAQREAAAEEAEQLFKLNIQSSPVAEEDPAAKEAALSNVTNALTQMGIPSRKAGTIRGRRDVRNTIYVPSGSSPELTNEKPFPPSPALPGGGSALTTLSTSKPAAVAALAHEASAASDNQSVRSGNSLGTLPAVKHPDMGEPGLNASIIETVTATFEGVEVKQAQISGEIAFAYNFSGGADQPTSETIRINNFPNLEVIGPNRIFVQNSSPDQNDQYTLDLSHLSSRASTAFTYRIHSDDPAGLDLGAYAPLLIKPVWKPKGDKLELLMSYGLSPTCTLPKPIKLANVVIFATYEGRGTGAQAKPSATHLREKHLVYWRLGDVTLQDEQEQRIMCRILGAEELKPGSVQARWELTLEGAEESARGISVQRLVPGKESDDDPFVDSVASPAVWEPVRGSYKLAGGKYEVKE